MNIAIVVFDKDWIDAKPLFAFLSAFGVKIKNQDAFGENKDQIKNSHLIVEGAVAEWTDIHGFKKFIETHCCTAIHYDSLIYNIKKCAQNS